MIFYGWLKRLIFFFPGIQPSDFPILFVSLPAGSFLDFSLEDDFSIFYLSISGVVRSFPFSPFCPMGEHVDWSCNLNFSIAPLCGSVSPSRSKGPAGDPRSGNICDPRPGLSQVNHDASMFLGVTLGLSEDPP